MGSNGDSPPNAPEMGDPMGFVVGTRIRVKSNQAFQIVDVLQKSQRRTVYSVKLVGEMYSNKTATHVLKCESVKDTDEAFKVGLRQERYVSHNIVKATPMEAERFSEFVAYGEKKNLFNFIIWKKLGPSLAELYQAYKMKFSIQTATRVNMQTAMAISKLHELNFIHRNVTPEHFVVGEHSKKVLYVISFSLSRKFGDDKALMPGLDSDTRRWLRKRGPKEPNISREVPIADQYFCPRYFYTSDCGVNLTRVDDLESWLYMSLYFVDPQAIPWKDVPVEMMTDVFNIKMDLFLHFYDHVIFDKVPLKYRRFISEINATAFGRRPDYDKILAIATDVAKEYCTDLNMPYDWEELEGTLLSEYGSFTLPDANGNKKEASEAEEQQQKRFKKLIAEGCSRVEAYKTIFGYPRANYPGQFKK